MVGFAVAQLGGEDDTRTLAATVDRAMPQAGGTLRVAGDEATLRLHDMPDLGATRVYQVWLQHGDRLVPARTFEVGAGGAGRVELPGRARRGRRLRDARAARRRPGAERGPDCERAPVARVASD